MCCSLSLSGSSLPSLEQLRCVESVVPCVRDLGTSLTRLSVLWLPHCSLRDLDGLPSLSSLQVAPYINTHSHSCLQMYNIVYVHTQELYISHNAVSDVSVVAMLPSLQVLDLERYNVYSYIHVLGYTSDDNKYTVINDIPGMKFVKKTSWGTWGFVPSSLLCVSLATL